MQEHALPTVRTGRYVTLGGAAGAVREVWIALHGYGQLAARFAAPFAPLASPERLVVAPEGLSRFYLESTPGRHERVGASWMTRADRDAEIADQLAWLDAALADACARFEADPRALRLVALGFSQGTATACRWLERSPIAAQRARRADRLILWGGALPQDLDLEANRAWLAAADLTLVAGDRDEFATPGRIVTEERRMQAAGVPYRVVSFPGGHRLHDATLAALAAGSDGTG